MDGRMDVRSTAAALSLNHCPRALALKWDLLKVFGQPLKQSRTCSGSGVSAARSELLVSHGSLQIPSAEQILKGQWISIFVINPPMVQETGPHHSKASTGF